MKLDEFPARFSIHLEADERLDLSVLYDRDPYVRDEGTLLHKALRVGLQQLYRDAIKSGPPRRTRTELEAGLRSKAQYGGQKAIPQDHAEVPTEHRHVETYLGVFVGERLRQRLEDFLGEYEALDEETAFALLLDLGLTKAEQEPEAVDPKAVLTDLQSKLTQGAAVSRNRRLNVTVRQSAPPGPVDAGSVM